MKFRSWNMQEQLNQSIVFIHNHVLLVPHDNQLIETFGKHVLRMTEI